MNNIKELRISKGLKQSDLANLLHVAQTTISNWENDRTEPDFDSLRQMAEIFDVSADYLLGQSDVKKKEKPVVKDDRLNRKLELLNDENLQRMEDYVDLLLKTQGE
jgi:transcriptional regulator with XRE-family HTH domain